jgi:hypothetical protein
MRADATIRMTPASVPPRRRSRQEGVAAAGIRTPLDQQANAYISTAWRAGTARAGDQPEMLISSRIFRGDRYVQIVM